MPRQAQTSPSIPEEPMDAVDLVREWAEQMGFVIPPYRQLPCEFTFVFFDERGDCTDYEFEEYRNTVIEWEENKLQSNHTFGPSENWTIESPNAYVEQARWRNEIRSSYRLAAWDLCIVFIGLVLFDDQGTNLARRIVYKRQPFMQLTRGEVDDYFRSQEGATKCVCIVGIEEGAEEPERIRYITNSRVFPMMDGQGRLGPAPTVLDEDEYATDTDSHETDTDSEGYLLGDIAPIPRLPQPFDPSTEDDPGEGQSTTEDSMTEL